MAYKKIYPVLGSDYQIAYDAAKAMRPDLFVTMAAYGDSGPGCIPTANAFKKGVFEVNVTKLIPQPEGAGEL